ncbi:MAG: DUF3656 domain-containing protein, partial [Clostridia bacterium]|nr:DUF3656 domain-containing protein [Clostridia bacterium]
MNKIELLAPAGNFDCLVAAVQSGADAVYISGKSFGARSFADNFDEYELEKAINYCHLRGVNIYITVNTLVCDAEISNLCEYLKFLNKAGADGIIVQDMGVLELARKIVPQLPLHASTQMTIHNSEGVKALERLGVKRVVLARELSLEMIKNISNTTNAELEVFGHGALCMCYSGQCLMSSIIGGRSGNRGKCAQPCRLPYSVNDASKKAFYMSLKDLSSLKHIEELKKIGVASLKIEGRMKGAAYVAAVVQIYRKYIDNPGKIESKDIELLDMIFNRGGLTDGYLAEKTGEQMFAFDKPDNPYLKGTDKLASDILSHTNTENRKLSLSCKIKIKIGEFPEITIGNEIQNVKYTGKTLVDKAKNTPLTTDMVKKQINKTGGTPFDFADIVIDIEDGAFLSAGELNALRRCAFEIFEEEYVKLFKRKDTQISAETIEEYSDEIIGGYVCEVTTAEQFDAVKNMPYRLFYIPLHVVLKDNRIFEEYKEKIVVVPPAIIDERTANTIFDNIEGLLKNGFYGVSANNIALAQRFKNYRVLGGFRLNIFNSHALRFYKNCGISVSEISPELNLRQIKGLTKSIPVQVMVYGRLPLMVTENCIIKNTKGCPCNGKNSITDRMGMVFPVIKDGDSCRNIVLNCKKTFMAFDIDKIKNAGVSFYRVYFTDETAKECIKISESFFDNTGYRP